MRKCYCSPVAECICIETYIIAASTVANRTGARTGFGVEDGVSAVADTGSWGNIWE